MVADGRDGARPGAGRPARPGGARPDAAGYRRAGGVPAPAGAGAGADRHPHRPGPGERPHRRARPRCRRLRGQAVLDQGAGRAGAGGAAPGQRAAGAAGPGGAAACWSTATSRSTSPPARPGSAGRSCRSPPASSSCSRSWSAIPRRAFRREELLEERVGLPLRRHVDGHRPRPAPAREDRARPVATRCASPPCGASATGGRASTPRCRPMTRARRVQRRGAGEAVARRGRRRGSSPSWRRPLLGLPADDTAVLVAISFGVALATYAAGRAGARAGSRSPVVVGRSSRVVVGGARRRWSAAEAMFVSSHDLAALVVVVVGAGTAGVLGGLALGAELARCAPPGRRRWPSASAPSSTAAASWSRG